MNLHNEYRIYNELFINKRTMSLYRYKAISVTWHDVVTLLHFIVFLENKAVYRFDNSDIDKTSNADSGVSFADLWSSLTPTDSFWASTTSNSIVSSEINNSGELLLIKSDISDIPGRRVYFDWHFNFNIYTLAYLSSTTYQINFQLIE